MPIRILDAATVGRIAAGEVVERPSSVVKELVENALDAGATSITVEIQNGGMDYLRVSDNGCGIAPEDARLAFENHATSKISKGEDLDGIVTLGFRGEALPSIAAVAKVEMITRQRGAESGVRVRIEGGKHVQLSDIGSPDGTTVTVRELFFNTPVRRAFLKKPSYEAGVISELVAKLILGNPKVSMRLINNGKTVYHSFGDGNLVHAALAVYGRDVAESLIALDESEGGLRIFGLVGVGECARANRSQQAFFINGRLVHCQLLSSALEESCKGRVMSGEFPLCALSVVLPLHAVDINVHPNKLEVRFRDAVGTRQSVEALFCRALAKNGGMLDPDKCVPQQVYERPSIQFQSPETINKQTEVCDKQTKVEIGRGITRNEKTEVCNHETPRDPKEASAAEGKPASKDSSAEQLGYIIQTLPERGSQQLREGYAPAVMPAALQHLPTERMGPLKVDTPLVPQSDVSHITTKEQIEQPLPVRVLGTAFSAYVFVEIENAVLLIDQHAAHERLLYEKYKSLLASESAAQQLLTPLILDVSKREMSLLMDNREMLFDIGYEIEPFGETAIRLLCVPHVLGQAEMKPLFLSMLEQLDQLRGATVERRRMQLITFCCKRAVKAGDRLAEDEILALIDDMRKSQAPPTCPHGRPVLKVFSKQEIERFFRR